MDEIKDMKFQAESKFRGSLTVTKPELNLEKGVITFLDILGWKGIWQRKDNSILDLEELINETRDKIRNLNNLYLPEKYPDLSEKERGKETYLLSISDTLIIYTNSAKDYAVDLHVQICSYIIPESIKRNIPVRGAISYGKFAVRNNIVVGPAVDEAASWHEQANWIGVILTPSTKYSLNGTKINNCCEYNAPLKSVKLRNMLCVKWDNNFEVKDILDYFIAMGPHMPKIGEKYENTIDFINEINGKI